jgi:uncharacterized membrane protein
MYGDKLQKDKRLQQIVEAIREAGNGVTQAALARIVGVSRSVINKDLVTLHERGVRLGEDEEGRLMWPD